jgi:hypothetical protein
MGREKSQPRAIHAEPGFLPPETLAPISRLPSPTAVCFLFDMAFPSSSTLWTRLCRTLPNGKNPKECLAR